MNVELRADASVYSNNGRSNCGHRRTWEDFANAPGSTLAENCIILGPGQPNLTSMNISVPATSIESLDFPGQRILRNSCFSRSSVICGDDLEAMIEDANTTVLQTQNDYRFSFELIFKN